VLTPGSISIPNYLSKNLFLLIESTGENGHQLRQIIVAAAKTIGKL
jgi:hypothetical protein